MKVAFKSAKHLHLTTFTFKKSCFETVCLRKNVKKIAEARP